MTDMNGKEIRKGDIVVVAGAYFKNDNGTYRVEHTPACEGWAGNNLSLRRVNKDGTDAKTNRIAFWPLAAFTTNREKNIAAKKHNAEFATIEKIDFQPAKSRKPQEGIKFMYNGIKIDGTLYRGAYLMGGWTDQPEGTIEIYAIGYTRFPRNLEGLKIINNSNSMIDYFEDDCIFVRPDNAHYSAVKSAYEKQQEKRKARHEHAA